MHSVARSILVMLVLAALVPASAAQGTDASTLAPGAAPVRSVVVNDTQVWTESTDISGLLMITATGKLTIDGATVNVNILAVDPGGQLILRSQPDAPAKIGPANKTLGWEGFIDGTLEAYGRPDARVILEGLSGKATRAGTSVAFEEGLRVSGRATLSNFSIGNYGSGVMVHDGGHLEGQDAFFASSAGMGIVVNGGFVDLARASFRGSGAGVFVMNNAGSANLTDASIDGAKTALVTSGDQMTLANVSVARTPFCLEAYLGTVSIDAFECHEFTKAGIRAHTTAGAPLSLSIARANISTSNASKGEGHGIDLDNVPNVSIAHSRLGPLPGNGLAERRTASRVDDVIASGVGIFDEILFDPPAGAAVQPRIGGAPGGLGWLEASWSVVPKVLLANGSPATNATITYYSPPSTAPILTQTAGQPTPNSPLRAVIVDAAGTRIVINYTAEARSEDGQETAKVAFVPDGRELVIHLQGVAAPEPRKVGAPGPLILSLAAGVVALFARRRK